jgi:hypothetical protein
MMGVAMSPSPPTITSTTRVRISPRVYARAFGDDLVLLDFAAGEYFGLDAVGADVWRGLEAGQPIAEIATSIAARYEVASDQAERDIVQLVGELAASSLIEMDEIADHAR